MLRTGGSAPRLCHAQAALVEVAPDNCDVLQLLCCLRFLRRDQCGCTAQSYQHDSVICFPSQVVAMIVARVARRFTAAGDGSLVEDPFLSMILPAAGPGASSLSAGDSSAKVKTVTYYSCAHYTAKLLSPKGVKNFNYQVNPMADVEHGGEADSLEGQYFGAPGQFQDVCVSAGWRIRMIQDTRSNLRRQAAHWRK